MPPWHEMHRASDLGIKFSVKVSVFGSEDCPMTRSTEFDVIADMKFSGEIITSKCTILAIGAEWIGKQPIELASGEIVDADAYQGFVFKNNRAVPVTLCDIGEEETTIGYGFLVNTGTIPRWPPVVGYC